MSGLTRGKPASPIGIIRKEFLGPDRKLRKLKPAFEVTSLGNGVRAACLDVARWQQDLSTAREWVEKIPPGPELHATINLLDEALSGRARFEEVAIIVGALIESYPNKPGSLGSLYFDSVMLMIEEADEPVSIFVLAGAYRRIVSSQKFIPSASEFLDACREVRRTFNAARIRVELMLPLRYSAEDVLEMAGEWKMAVDEDAI